MSDTFGPRVVVEFTEHEGKPRRQTYSSFNSGGATEFAGKQVGGRVDFTLQLDSPAPYARRSSEIEDRSGV